MSSLAVLPSEIPETLFSTCLNPPRLCSHPCRTQKKVGAYLQGSPKRWEADATMPLIQQAVAFDKNEPPSRNLDMVFAQ